MVAVADRDPTSSLPFREGVNVKVEVVVSNSVNGSTTLPLEPRVLTHAGARGRHVKAYHCISVPDSWMAVPVQLTVVMPV